MIIEIEYTIIIDIKSIIFVNMKDDLETFGYIYAIVKATTEKGLPIKQALEKIRKILDKRN